MVWVLCCDYISEQLNYVLLLLFTFVKLTHLIQITAAADPTTDSAVGTLEGYKHTAQLPTSSQQCLGHMFQSIKVCIV